MGAMGVLVTSLENLKFNVAKSLTYSGAVHMSRVSPARLTGLI